MPDDYGPPVAEPVIGDLFLAKDELARWVTVMCLARNDVELTHRVLAETIQSGNKEGTASHWSRVLRGHLLEAAKFMRKSNERSLIERFTKTWEAADQKAYQELLDPKFLKTVLIRDRNLMFHYPSADVEDATGGPALFLALHEFRDRPLHLAQSNEEVKTPGFRYAFADEIAAHFATEGVGDDADELQKPLAELKAKAEQLVTVADIALREFRKARPESREPLG
jgi:hypothetical protein